MLTITARALIIYQASISRAADQDEAYPHLSSLPKQYYVARIARTDPPGLPRMGRYLLINWRNEKVYLQASCLSNLDAMVAKAPALALLKDKEISFLADDARARVAGDQMPLDRMIQRALDLGWVDQVEDLPYTDQDGTVLDEESLRSWLEELPGMYGEEEVEGGSSQSLTDLPR